MKALLRVALFVLVLVSLARTVRADAPDRATPRPASTSPTPLFVRAYGGASRGAALASMVEGPSGGFGLGVGVLRRPWGGLDLAFDGVYDALETPHDVGIRRLAFGPSVELRVWRFHIGVGGDVGSAWIARVSSSTIAAQTYYLGGHATLGVDIVTIGCFTLYVAARGDLNAYLPSVGGNAGLRVAF